MSSLPVKLDPKCDRIIVLIDMDCFYCQVEEKLNPSLKGKPIAVVQYNAWKGGGIIAVNYPARDRGVTRHMRGDEAKQHCSDIELVKVPNIRQKADLSKYRDAGKEVAHVLQNYTSLLERASVDEAYLDITEKVLERLQQMNQGKFVLQPEKLTNSYAIGYDNIGDFVQDMSGRLKLVASTTSDDEKSKMLNKNDIKLLIAASIVNEIRADVKDKTGYECSAGIAHNKILAKLVCGINKPNKQTILSMRHLDNFYKTLSIKKIKGLGGKFGDEVCQKLNIKLMCELQKISLEELRLNFDEKNGLWLQQISQGIDTELVTPRFASKSIGCCKKFPGRTAIKGIATLKHWLNELSNEIIDRLQKDEIENNRKATQMTVSYVQEIKQIDVSSSRSVPANINDVEKLAADALDVIRKNTQTFFQSENEKILNNEIKFLGINVGKFVDLDDSGKQISIQNMFLMQTAKKLEANCSKKTETETVIKDQINCLSIDNEADENSNTKSSKQTVLNFKEESKHLHTNEPEFNSKATENEILSYTKPNINSNSLKEFAENRDSNEITEKEVQINNESCNEDSNQDLEELFQIETTELEENNALNETLELEKQQEPNDTHKSDILPDYKQTYAEFQHSTRNNPEQLEDTTDTAYQNCTQCNKNVPVNEFQMHTDRHIAFKLSQEQRIEYRSQLKLKSSPSNVSPANKRIKMENSKSTEKTKPLSLDKFFKRTTDATATAGTCHSDSTIVDKEMCRDCGKLIATDSISMHADYHTAKRLQFQINQQNGPTIQKNSSQLSQSNQKSQLKVKSNKNSNKTSTNKSKSITSFFTK